MIDDLKYKAIDLEVNHFVKNVKSKYGVNVHVVLGGLTAPRMLSLVPLETLAEEAHSAMVIYDPTLQHIKSLKEKTRKRDVIQWVHCFYHIAWHQGYSKTAIGRAVNRDHATVIHGIKTVDSYLSISDLMVSDIYSNLMNHYKDNVGNFSENSKR